MNKNNYINNKKEENSFFQKKLFQNNKHLDNTKDNIREQFNRVHKNFIKKNINNVRQETPPSPTSYKQKKSLSIHDEFPSLNTILDENQQKFLQSNQAELLDTNQSFLVDSDYAFDNINNFYSNIDNAKNNNNNSENTGVNNSGNNNMTNTKDNISVNNPENTGLIPNSIVPSTPSSPPNNNTISHNGGNGNNSINSADINRKPTPSDSPSVNDDKKNYKDTWTRKIESLLTILYHNCKFLSKYHNYRYYRSKNRLKLFRIPIIFLSAVNAYAAIGLQNYIAQKTISTINSVISLLCGIITTIEIFLNIQKKMENDLLSHRDYSVLGVEIMKMLLLDESKRNQDGKTFLDEKYSKFLKISESSNVIDPRFYVDVFDLSNMREMNNRIKSMVNNETSEFDITRRSTIYKKSKTHNKKQDDYDNSKKQENNILNKKNNGGNYKKFSHQPENDYYNYGYGDSDESHADRMLLQNLGNELIEFLKFKPLRKMYNPQLYALKEERNTCYSNIRHMTDSMAPVKNVIKKNRKNSMETLDIIDEENESEDDNLIHDINNDDFKEDNFTHV